MNNTSRIQLLSVSSQCVCNGINQVRDVNSAKEISLFSAKNRCYAQGSSQVGPADRPSIATFETFRRRLWEISEQCNGKKVEDQTGDCRSADGRASYLITPDINRTDSLAIHPASGRYLISGVHMEHTVMHCCKHYLNK